LATASPAATAPRPVLIQALKVRSAARIFLCLASDVRLIARRLLVSCDSLIIAYEVDIVDIMNMGGGFQGVVGEEY